MTVHCVEDPRLLDLYGIRMERVEFRGLTGELVLVEHRPIKGQPPRVPGQSLVGCLELGIVTPSTQPLTLL